MTGLLGALLQQKSPFDHGFEFGFPVSASVEGGRIDTLFWVMTVITVPLLLGVVGFVLYCLIRFREKPGRKAVPIAGFKTAMGTSALVVGLMLMELPLDFYQEKLWADATLNFPKPEDSLVVQVFAEQFAWNFRYAGKDGTFGTPDDVTTVNLLRVPEGKPVVCLLKSRDVIHSFWLPHFRVKLDVMPGVVHRVWFRGAKPGMYELACAELCGLGHYTMRGVLRVLPPEEYAKWLEGEMEEVAEDGPGPEAAKWKLWGASP